VSSDQNFVCISHLPICATFPIPLILLDLITLIMCGGVYKLWISLCRVDKSFKEFMYWPPTHVFMMKLKAGYSWEMHAFITSEAFIFLSFQKISNIKIYGTIILLVICDVKLVSFWWLNKSRRYLKTRCWREC
jgi:hypothetical protein